jgi:membrane-bound serine protease (ClpP class)
VILTICILLAIFVLDEPWSWVVAILGILFEVAETTLFVWWSKRRKATVGAETLIGRRALVSSPCMPVGQVKVAGEIWQARCEAGADVGDEVIVSDVSGLVLLVEQP